MIEEERYHLHCLTCCLLHLKGFEGEIISYINNNYNNNNGNDSNNDNDCDHDNNNN